MVSRTREKYVETIAVAAEGCDVIVGATGAVSVFSGGTSFGQGIETALAQIAADALGVSPEVVRVVNGDTARMPFGMGSWASRTTVVAGNAVHAAALAVRDRARQVVPFAPRRD